ncbi:phosphotransferase [Streptomyces halobius]|uniref:Aminoglycoside phosphotransferase family protein n=1 Tax=Streptomyces halobius TaxID=2879846 RepID=A0ABY4M204_9ACTN|nr:phosphotransferase [Streptomyces halobius]UQA91457.1 aminoglycoside phosphotransferase family protein [Streptomyces halobius]
MMDDWRFVKKRTADPAGGAVYVTEDGTRYRRTGGQALAAEAAYQQQLAELGYPVPRVLADGVNDDGHLFVVEESLGERSLHDMALESLDGTRTLSNTVVDLAAEVGGRLLRAQAAHAVTSDPQALRAWVREAGWTDNVLGENPDLDTPRVRAALERAVAQLAGVPMVRGHLDYGLPNVLPVGVIDWQHHGLVPLGYDTALALEIIPFKGGTKGYLASPEQRRRYLEALNQAARATTGQPLSQHLGPYLLVKGLFFLALMKPTDPARTDKHLKWQYRRHLFMEGLEQYERTGAIDPARFPTLDDFAARHSAPGHP